MNDTITIADPGWDWGFTLLAVSPATGVLLAIIISLVVLWAHPSSRIKRNASEVAQILAFALLFLSFLTAIAVVLGGSDMYEDRVSGATIAALEDLGLTDVDLSGTVFTANQDGAYFRGALVSDGHLTWQVLELTDTK